ncbi:hypothetical protein MAUB1S_00030 [Mycolicibacterium aubagnense]
MRVKAWVLCLGQLVEQHLDALGLGGHGAQGVQRADIARTFPDAHQRGLPVQPRHARLLRVAVAAEALHGLRGVRRRALAHPVLGRGQTDSAEQAFALVATDSAVGGPGHAHREHGGGLGLDGHVGQHVAHQRLVDQVRTERLAVLRVVHGLGQTRAHAGGATECAVQSGQVDHLDDGRHAAAFLTDQPHRGAVVLDFAGGVGVVAELVLEPLDEHPVAGAVGQHPGQEETGQPAGRLGQHQEHVPHRCRGEPLVAAQRVGAVAVGGGLGGPGPDVRTALLLGHRHARGDTRFRSGHFQLWVVHPAGQQRLVDLRELGVEPQRRDDGVGHRDRADVAGFRGPGRHLRRPDDVGAGTVVGPRSAVQTVRHRGVHQLVVGGVVFDLVHAVAVAVVCVQDRDIAVRELTPALRDPAATEGADLVDLVDAPLPAVADQGLGKRREGGGVVVLQRRNLVRDDMRITHALTITLFLQPHKNCIYQRWRTTTSVAGSPRWTKYPSVTMTNQMAPTRIAVRPSSVKNSSTTTSARNPSARKVVYGAPGRR